MLSCTCGAPCNNNNQARTKPHVPAVGDRWRPAAAEIISAPLRGIVRHHDTSCGCEIGVWVRTGRQAPLSFSA